MVEAQVGAAADRQTSMAQILGEYERTASPRIIEFARLAGAVQLKRYEDQVSDTSQVTRSTALWALMQLDIQIRRILESCGLDHSALGEVLKIRGAPAPVDTDDPALHPDFARALRTYLAAVDDGWPIGLPDVAAAILHAARDDREGLLPGRLRGLRVDISAAIAALETLIVPTKEPEPPQGGTGTAPEASHPPASADFGGHQYSRTALAVLDDALRIVKQPGLVSPGLVWLTALDDALASERRDVASALLEVLGDQSKKEPSAVVDAIAQTLGVALPAEFEYSTADVEAELASVRWIAQAAQLASRTESSTTSQRHLLAAAVLDDEFGSSVPQAVGLSISDLRLALRRAIKAVLPTEVPQRWDEILLSAESPIRPDGPSDGAVAGADLESASELAGGISADLVSFEGGDRLKDDLGLATYVRMLATVVSRDDTPLPLSIGLFGEWGSGKSYFMGLLRQQVAELSTSGDSYVSKIEQISFNAWHYADTNLWASLGDEIFEQLAGPAEKADARRTRLRKELSEQLERRKALDAATAQAHAEALQLREELEKARTARATSARNMLASVWASKTVKKHLARAWRSLGVTDDVDQIKLLVDETRGVRDDVLTLRRVTSGRRGIVLFLILAAAFGCLALAAIVATGAREWLLRGGLSALAATAALLAGFLAWARSGARQLSRAVNEIRAEASKRADQQLAQQIAQLQDAVAREEVLNTQLDEVMARAGQIGRELAELAPGQRLYSFINERAASGDYRRELGLISTIRRDFEHLIELMHDWETNPEQEVQDLAIKRIVLYIDDLDRCSPEQVVDVLQAVHLLLALNLFVVVVGVDPRWLMHSLRHTYRENFAELGTAARARPDREDDPDWATAPLDYLEKIFNIPFVLPHMTGESFTNLIHGLSTVPDSTAETQHDTGNGSPAGTESRGDRPTSTPDESTPGTEPSGPTPVTQPSIPAETGSEVASIQQGVSVPPLGLTDRELEMLSLLGPLVETPREAKRVLNLYRTLRSTRDLSPASQFLSKAPDGEFQAVALLLGLLSARPSLVGSLLWAVSDPTLQAPGGLTRRDPHTLWKSAFEGLTPRLSSDGSWHNDLGRLQERDQAAWSWIVQRARPAAEHIGLTDITAFQTWGPRIARFSFVLSPLAAEWDQSPVSAPEAAER